MAKLFELLWHPTEILPTAQMYAAAKRAATLPKEPNRAFCYGILNAVSRSFGVVITQLPPELQDATCVFYLVLRALDTVEDDMAIDNATKLPLLNNFYTHITESDFRLDFGDGKYKELLQEFPKVHRVLLDLSPSHRHVIVEITRRMGEGMAEFIEKDVKTVDDYDKYCFYVAGLVGLGLSKLFVAAGLESKIVEEREELSIHMGLYLQKVNIVRDYLEDIMEQPAPRMFWPKEIWGLYADALKDFKEPKNRTAAKRCLNHMIVDQLRHVLGCFHFMEMIKTPSIFSFCAIPQVMAVATAALCFDNDGVFEGVVKLRRGQTCKMFRETRSMSDIYRLFDGHLETIQKRLPKAEMDQRIREKAEGLIGDARSVIAQKQKMILSSSTPWAMVIAVLILAVLIYYWMHAAQE